MRIAFKEPVKIVPLCIVVLSFFTLYLVFYPCIMKTFLYPIYRGYKKYSFLYESRNFKARTTRNFNIYYRDEDSAYMDMISGNAEESLKKVTDDFHYSPGGKINLIVYPEYREMAKRIGLGTGSKAMGAYFGGTIGILDPGDWIEDGGDAYYAFEKDGPMVHELTHYVLDYITSGNIPIWYTEGAALYEEYRANGTVWASDRTYDSYYTMSELERNFSRLDEVKSYKQSFIIVKYIGDNYGMNSIIDIAIELGKGYDMGRAIEKVLQMNKAELFKRSLHI